jgi:hypothetical protein
MITNEKLYQIRDRGCDIHCNPEEMKEIAASLLMTRNILQDILNCNDQKSQSVTEIIGNQLMEKYMTCSNISTMHDKALAISVGHFVQELAKRVSVLNNALHDDNREANKIIRGA